MGSRCVAQSTQITVGRAMMPATSLSTGKQPGHLPPESAQYRVEAGPRSSWQSCGLYHVCARRLSGVSRRNACTRSKTSGQSLTVRPEAEHAALQAARAHQQTPEFKQAYAVRARGEGTISQGVAVSGLRRSRYIGCARTHLQHGCCTESAAGDGLVGRSPTCRHTHVPICSTRRGKYVSRAPMPDSPATSMLELPLAATHLL